MTGTSGTVTGGERMRQTLEPNPITQRNLG
jgi:hypothetical protein